MNSESYFSVVIPCLDEEKSLPLLLSDLQKQTLTKFEVFVVDGKSDDKSQAVVKAVAKADPRFHLLVSNKRNVGHQRNLGASKAKGKYLLFLDADDRIPDYYLSGLHFLTAKEENIDSFTTYATVDTNNPKDKVFIRMTNAIFDAGAKMNMPFSYGACIGCRRKIFAELKGFDESVAYGEDTEFVRRLSQAGYRFVVFKEPTYVYSMRRFQKEGTLRLIRKLAPAGLKMVMNKTHQTPLDIYPMLGGKYFEESEQNKENKQDKQTIQQIDAIHKALKEMFSK